jgi:PAS domain S-box-containing protein
LQDDLQLILDSAPAMIWDKDTENRIIHANQSAPLSMGMSKEQIEGRESGSAGRV